MKLLPTKPETHNPKDAVKKKANCNCTWLTRAILAECAASFWLHNQGKDAKLDFVGSSLLTGKHSTASPLKV